MKKDNHNTQKSFSDILKEKLAQKNKTNNTSNSKSAIQKGGIQKTEKRATSVPQKSQRGV